MMSPSKDTDMASMTLHEFLKDQYIREKTTPVSVRADEYTLGDLSATSP
jgi:hypothetical protein